MAKYRNLGTSIFFVCLGITVFLAGSLHVWGMGPWGAYLVAISVVTFACLGWDKAGARGARNRVPENCLHALALIGGSPGSLMAQRFFRHKTAKKSFQRWFWGIVAAQFLGLILFVLLN